MDRAHTPPFVVNLDWKLGSACNLYLNPQRSFFVRMFLAAVLLGICIEFGLVVSLYLAFHDSTPAKAETEATVHKTTPPHRSNIIREWYLSLLWDVHHQTPDHHDLTALYGRSDSYIQNYILPRTSEDFDAAKSRILSPLGPDPSNPETHTMIVLEAYTVNRCAERYSEQCYLLDFTHSTVGNYVLAPLGRTTAYTDVVDGYYSRPWENWTIPRPSLRR